MTAPHEIAFAGPAADLAATLAAGVPVIDTPRLRLRAPGLHDLPAWLSIFTTERAAHICGPFSRDDAFTEFAATVGLWLLRGHGPWAVERRDGGGTIGFVLVGFEAGDREPELGFLFTAEGEGHGFAQEAALAARDWALRDMRLPRLVSYIAPGNVRSRALARRLGARPDGMVDGAEVWRHAPGTETAA
ncbi:MAG: GNAT family N-acetyltransferase [Paracoccaceae bacterium]|nr:MAG: GNAT family N-acetyltransferase [Paracoccaceae bacterium]